MDSKYGVLPLDNAEECRCWLIAFEAHCRSKDIEDEVQDSGTSPKTDKFLERCGTKPLLKIISMMPGRNIESALFKDIKNAISEYIEPRKRLIIADRTNFLQISQHSGETEVDFLSRLNDASVYCEWDRLKEGNPTEELIKLRFIAGLRDEKMKLKVLEKLQLNPESTINEIVDFCQMSNQLTDFVNKVEPGESSKSNSDNFFVSKNASKKPCGKCGTYHKIRECPAYGKKCNKCGKTNHFAKCCKSKNKNSSSNSNRNQNARGKDTHNIDCFTILTQKSEGIMQSFVIMGVKLDFQLDTGAAASILSRRQWEKLGSPQLAHTELRPTNYDGSVIKTLGCLSAGVQLENELVEVKFMVVESDRQYGLIGRDLIDKKRTTVSTLSIETDFLPTIKNFSASIKLIDENKSLKFCRARSIPVHLRDKIDNELECLQKQGVITSISHAKHASPVVWVKKADGRYRMCVDFKATLNSNIQSDAYPLPTVEEIFARIGRASKFARVDLKSAYWQIALDEKARELSVINTHRGLFCVNRLQMGMKNSSAIFQKCMEQILKEIDGVIIYQDDIMICAESERQLKKRLGLVYKRLEEYEVTLNREKCVSSTDSLKFLGFIFSKEGIKPDKSLTHKITDAEVPQNGKELASFLGMATYYGRFIPGFAEICAPLHDAKVKEPFVWTEECDKNFNLLKEKLTSAPVLVPFATNKTSVITVDASQKAIGAVLTQESHPVLYISRKLTVTESKYSNIEREALAVIWACRRLEQFLLGKKFLIQTDHKPLVYIFSPELPVKSDVSPRLLKFSLKMMHYDFEIKHISGSNNVVADALSRVINVDDTKLPKIHFSEPCISLELLKNETNSDRFLLDLKRRISNGNWSNVSKREKPFKRFAWQLSVDKDDIIRLGSKIVPPQSIYRRIFDVVHQTHNGVQATLHLIQQEFFWPNMRSHIEEMVKSCQQCRTVRFKGEDTTHTWPKDSTPWSRIHIDWAYHRTIGNILVVVDSNSGWLEAAALRDRRTSSVIDFMRSIFARFGIPYCVVSDNAPEFTCGQFSTWLSSIGSRLLHSPEYRPQANGAAERMVRVIKDGLKSYNPTKCSAAAYIQRLLIVHRNTAIREGKTPAEIMLGRNVRCPILSQYEPSQELLYRAHTGAQPSTVKYIMRQGRNTQLVEHADGRTVLAHDAQLTSATSSYDTDNADSNKRQLPMRNRAPPEFYGAPVTH